MITKNTLHFYS